MGCAPRWELALVTVLGLLLVHAGVAAAAAPDLSITRCQELLQTLSQSDGVYQGLSLNGAVFCPTNSALDKFAKALKAGNSKAFLKTKRFDQLLRNVLSHHTVPVTSSGGVALDVSSAFNRTGTYTYKDLKGGALELTVTSLSPLTLGVLGGLSKTLNQLQPVMLDAAPTVRSFGLDLSVVVYAVDTVLMPLNTYLSVEAALAALPELTYVTQYLKPLRGLFSKKECTLLLPVDLAWEALLPFDSCSWSWYVGTNSIKDDAALRKRIMAYHIYTGYADTVKNMMGYSAFTELRAGTWYDKRPDGSVIKRTQEPAYLDYAADGKTEVAYGYRNWFWFLNGFNITGVDVNNGAYPLPPSPFSDIPVSPIHPIIRNIYAGSCIIHAITGRPMVPWTVGISKYDTEQPSSNQQQQCSGLGGLLGGGSFVAPAGNSRSGFNRGGVGSKSSRGGSRGYD